MKRIFIHRLTFIIFFIEISSIYSLPEYIKRNITCHFTLAEPAVHYTALNNISNYSGNYILKNEFVKNRTSGEVNILPWDSDVTFKNMQNRYNTPVLMAAYCAVLNDPLKGEEENVHIGSRLLCGTVVEPNQVFSQNRAIGPYTASRGYIKGPTYSGTHLTTTTGGGVCKIASTLYNVAVKSNLKIIERHAHCMPVSYVPYGQDATVYYGSFDFKFKNTTGSPLLIWSQAIDNALYIAIYGRQAPPKVEWHHDILSVKKTTRIYKINKALPPGKERLIVTGMDGASLNSWVIVTTPDGTIVKKQMGKSIYKPLPYIYERGN